MTTLTYNNFKSTTIRGDFHNADNTTNSIIANAVFDRDIHVSGNIIIGTQDLLTLLQQLTYTAGYGIKWSTDYPTSSTGNQKKGYECFWNDINPGYGQTDFLNYSQAGSNGGFTFNTMKTNNSGNLPIELLSLSVNNSTFLNTIICPSLTLNGIDLATTLSTFLTSASLSNYVLSSSLTTTLSNYVLTTSLSNYITSANLSGYANLTAASNTFTGNVIFNNGNVAIGTVNSPANQYLDVYSTTTFTKFVAFQNGLTTDSIIYNGTELTTTLSNYPTLSASINIFSGGCSFNTLATFFGGINTDTITFNGVNLNTRLNTYVTSTSLTTTLSSYALTTALSNYVLSSSLSTLLQNLTHSPGFGFNASTFPTTSAGDNKYGYDAFWNQSNGIGETDLLSYGQGGVGGFRFYSLNTSSSSSTPQQLLSTDVTNGTIIKTNLTVTGIQNACRKSITYLSSSSTFYLTASNLTSIYVVTNNATVTFNCFAPVQNVTDGYELCIRNGGTGTVYITGCVPLGANINTVAFSVPLYQSCKMISGAGYWYQI